MAPVDLHALPAGSVVAAPGVVAMRGQYDGPRPWLATASQAAYTAGDLLGMSQDWIVLRKGPTVTDEHTGGAPEVRHYIAEVGDLRAHMTMTGRDDGGRIVTDRHPWEPLTDVNGAAWYRVSDAVAAEYDWDTDDEDPSDDTDTVRGPRRASTDLDQL